MAGPRSFPKAARVRRRPEFLAIQRDGTRRHTRHLVVIRRASEAPLARLGVTVSTRVGNAVARNRVKRLLREAFRLRRRELAPVDLVVIAKPGATELTLAQAERELAEALGLAASALKP